jgi:hypothetical protein
MSAKEIRDQGLDKFYTDPNYALHCIKTINEKYDASNWDLVVEPSAGNGSFLTHMTYKNIDAVDLQPEHHDIVKQNFFTYSPHSNYINILVLGNPPFGKISSLAVSFFNHAAQWAQVIAFIVPRTFRRVSVQNKLCLDFHLVHDEDTPCSPCCFNPPIAAKCCFQIWERNVSPREIIHLPTSHSDWIFLKLGPLDANGQPTPPENAEFALRAYGGNIGHIVTENLSSLRPKSWHWIKANINSEVLVYRFRNLDYSESTNTARQNSMGRGDLVALYSASYD